MDKKNKNQRRKSEEVLLSGAQCSGPDTHTYTQTHTHTCSSCTWPPCDPHNFPTFKNAVKEAILPVEFIRVCVRACIPRRLSPPSLDKNYIIAACDLIFLKEHFEVSFPLLLFLFPLCPTCFNVKMTHIKLPGSPPFRYAILQRISSLLSLWKLL